MQGVKLKKYINLENLFCSSNKGFEPLYLLYQLLRKSVVSFKKSGNATVFKHTKQSVEESVESNGQCVCACVPSVPLRLPGAKGSSRNGMPMQSGVPNAATRGCSVAPLRNKRVYYYAWFAFACLRRALKVWRWQGISLPALVGMLVRVHLN